MVITKLPISQMERLRSSKEEAAAQHHVIGKNWELEDSQLMKRHLISAVWFFPGAPGTPGVEGWV